MKKILCVGIVTTDIITRTISRLPGAGELAPVESVSMHMGGCAANAAVDLKRLGLEPSLVVKIGKDGFGDFVLDTLRQEGVDTSHCVVDATAETAATTVLVAADGQRTFLHNPGANDKLTSEDVPQALLEEADILFIAGTFLMHGFDGEECKKLLLRAHEAGVMTVLDTAFDYRGGWMKTLKCCLPHIDLFAPSEDEASALAGGITDVYEMATLFHQCGPKNVVIKCGMKGALMSFAGEEEAFIPSYPVKNPADTTGAGDSFCAGMLAGLALGRSPLESVKLGNAVGHFCVTGVGASSGIPDLQTCDRLIESAAL